MVKPDMSNSATNTTGVVRDTKMYLPFIMLANSRLCDMAGIDCPDVSEFTEFKRSNRSDY